MKCIDARKSAVFVLAVLLGVVTFSFGMIQHAHAAQAVDADAGLVAGGAFDEQGEVSAMAVKLTATATSVVWNSSIPKPKLVVKCGTKKLKSGRDYKAIYPNPKKTGRYKVKIVGKGKYANAKTAYAYYYVYPHNRKVAWYEIDGNDLAIDWETHPDGTDEYAFVFSPTTTGIKAKCQSVFFGKKITTGKWDALMRIKNTTIKSRWTAGRAYFDISKYMGKAYKKNYIYLCIIPMKKTSTATLLGSATVKKINF